MSEVNAGTAPVDVCVVTTIHPPLDARIYRRSVLALAAAGFSVSVICPWREPADAPTSRWTSLDPARTRLGRIAAGYRTFLLCLREQASVFHFHDLDFLPWAVLLRHMRRVTVVYDCHENYPEEIAYAKHYIPQQIRPVVAGLVRVLENVAVRHLGWVVVAVPSQARRFEPLGVECVVSRNLAGQKVYADLRHSRGVVCIGTLSENYGVWVLLEIARELMRRNAGVHMLLTDRFVSEDMRDGFITACREEGLDVTIHPRVLPAELPELLTRASVGLSVEQDSPEKRIALPSKLFDYMATGLPVVASDLPNTREVVMTAGSGLVVGPADASAFVNAILRLLDEDAFRESCRQAGFRAMKGEFSWSNEAKKLADFFHRIIARS